MNLMLLSRTHGIKRLIWLHAIKGGGAIEYDTITGDIVTFTAVAKPITSLVVAYSPKQDLSHGDPSPSNLCPITGTDEVDVWRTGGNMVDQASGSVSASNWWIGSTATNSEPDGSFVLPSGTYTFSVSDTMSGLYVRKNGANVASAYNNTKLTFTLTEPTAVRLMLYKAGVGVDYWASLNIMLELGSTGTPYSPYIGDSISSSLPNTLYGGTVDVVTGEVTVTHVYALLNDPDKWSVSTGVTDFVYDTQYTDRKLYDNNSYDGLACSYVPIRYGDEPYGRWLGATNYRFGIKWANGSLADIKADAQAGKISIVYELATPQTIQLTPTAINAFKGTNTVWSNGDSVTVEYPHKGA